MMMKKKYFDLHPFRNRLVPLIVWGVWSVFASHRFEGAEPQATENLAQLATEEPLLRLDTGGPAGFVTTLAFSPDNQSLYAGGWDKVVRGWSYSPEQRWVDDRQKTVRVPVGPGLDGAINAIALSPDGKRLAIAGRGLITGAAGFHHGGRILPSLGGMSNAMRLEEGIIYLFDTQTREVSQLRGHLGPVLALAFDGDDTGGVVLVSAGQEPGTTPTDFRAVIRLWNITTHAYLKGAYLDVANVRTRPQLAIQRMGINPQDVRVLVAWNDGKLRIWDASQNAKPQSEEDGRNNKTISLLPGNRRFLTGSLQGADGKISFWQWDAAGRPQRETQFQLPPKNGVHYIPQAMSVVVREGREFLALGCQSVQIENSQLLPVAMELQLLDLTTRQVIFQSQLWRNQGTAGTPVPTLVSSVDGEHVAVAGGPEHVVHLFKLADMLARRDQPEQLRGQSSLVTEAHFVRRESTSALGVFMKEAETNQGLVFDHDTRLLTPWNPNDGWQHDPPETKNWSLSKGQGKLTVRAPDGKQILVELPVDQEEVTAHAIYPGNQEGSPAMMAVASHSLGQPQLGLYELVRGQQVRQYTGHTARILSLAFSSDGRLLVSTGQDHTVQVWSLTDLDQVLNKHGMLTGVAVQDRTTGGVIVADVTKNSSVVGRVLVGDRLAGYVVAGKLIPWSNAREFYDTWWQTKPSSSMTVRVDRNGQASREVVLQAGQGTDERKPLYSFFIARPTEGHSRQWIGWSPLGPFESSDEQIEQFLGWHLQNGDPRRPVGFADVNQFRKEFYREGLLKELVTHGRLLPQREEGPLPPPAMSLMIPELGNEPERSNGRLLLRETRDMTLALNLDFEFPVHQVGEVECWIDGQKVGAMRRVASRRWQFELSSSIWDRQEHTLSTVIHSLERRPQQFRQDLRVRIQPNGPTIELTESSRAALDNLTISDTQLSLDADVVAPAPENDIQVALFLFQDGNRVEVKRDLFRGRGRFTALTNLPSKAGPLQIEAKCLHPAIPGAVSELTVQNIPLKQHRGVAVPPTMRSLHVESNGKLIGPIAFGETVVVSSADVLLTGDVASATESSFSLQMTEPTVTKPADVIVVKNEDGEIQFRSQLSDLKPFQTTAITVVANAGEVTSSWQFVIDYQPQLPEIEIISPDVESRVILVHEQQGKLDVEAKLRFPGGKAIPSELLSRLRAALQIDNQIPQPAEIDPSQTSIAARALLPVGTSSVRILLYLDATLEPLTTSELIHVSCVDAVKIPELRVIRAEGETEAEVQFIMQAESGISALWLGNHEVAPDNWVANHETGEIIGRAKVDLDPEITNLDVHVSGLRRPFRFQLPEPETIKVPQPPQLEFPALGPATKTSKSSIEVDFVVRSSTGISRIELIRKGVSVYEATPDELQRASAGDGKYLFERSVDVRLDDGQNSLQLVADNADGRQMSTINIARIPSLVRVVVDDVITPDGQRVDLSSQGVDAPFATLRGRVIWSDPDDVRLRSQLHASIWVGGFQQSFVDIKPATDGLERSFETQIFLSKQGDNIVEMEVPDLQHDVGDPLTFKIPCSRPNTNYRLHLLVIGVGANVDGNALVTQAMETLDGKRNETSDRLFQTPVFAQGWIYGPVTGDAVSQKTVLAQLLRVSDTIVIQNRQRGTPAQDVIMIYYTGGELVPQDHQFYLTTKTDQDPAKLKYEAIPSNMLLEFVNVTRGAHLLLLDVSRGCDGHCRARTWPPTSHAALLRYAWLRPGEMPAELRLLTALHGLDRTNNELGELEERLELQYNQASQRFPASLAFDRHVPAVLKDLQLRRPSP